jgi:hypothetical protein
VVWRKFGRQATQVLRPLVEVDTPLNFRHRHSRVGPCRHPAPYFSGFRQFAGRTNTVLDCIGLVSVEIYTGPRCVPCKIAPRVKPEAV